jgi:glycosyltransferase involved in cell wall biosynthesis
VALESALAQTYPHIEIIVVDDGSTDDTTAMIAPYASRVTYLKQVHQGATAARNAGARAASGEYLTFLNDDDLILPTKIERQVEMLTSQPSAGLVHCRYYRVDQKGHLQSKTGVLPEGAVLRKLLERNFIWIGAPLIRRRCLNRVGLFDPSLPTACADWDLWLRIALEGYQFGCVQELLGIRRTHGHNVAADTAALEQATQSIFDRLLSSPKLPADLSAEKEQISGSLRLWIACRYYAAACWEDARRSLSQALELCPRILDDQEQLLDRLSDAALGGCVDDPFKFIDGVLDHLPPAAEAIRPHRPYLIGRLYIRLALASYGCGRIVQARRQLADAFSLYPAGLQRPEEFIRAVCTTAMTQPGDPSRYIDTVFQNLPPEASRLESTRSRVESDVNIGCAFEDYFGGRQGLAARRILSALCHRPAWLGNRGVVSVLVRSLPGLLTAKPTSP